MKLPADSRVAREKLTHYLLVRQQRGDKSAFRASAGYRLENADQLERDLREQILSLDAVLGVANEFGQYYQISSSLRGPNGTVLAVRTIWMTERLSGVTKFITLIPAGRNE